MQLTLPILSRLSPGGVKHTRAGKNCISRWQCFTRNNGKILTR